MILKYVNKNNKYTTVRQVLKQEFHIASRFISKLKQEQAICLNGVPMYIDKELAFNDIVTVNIDFDEENTGKIVPVEIKLDILFEDESFLIVNKPPFMPVHPSASHFTDTLSNGVQYYYNSIGLNHKVRLVNRLDKDTSGIVIFAKNSYIQECMIQQMKTSYFKKEYVAIVNGIWKQNLGTINAPISRKEGSIIERIVSPFGDIAITHFEKMKQFENYTQMRFLLETGRTHQIRVHCAYVRKSNSSEILYMEKLLI